MPVLALFKCCFGLSTVPAEADKPCLTCCQEAEARDPSHVDTTARQQNREAAQLLEEATTCRAMVPLAVGTPVPGPCATAALQTSAVWFGHQTKPSYSAAPIKSLVGFEIPAVSPDVLPDDSAARLIDSSDERPICYAPYSSPIYWTEQGPTSTSFRSGSPTRKMSFQFSSSTLAHSSTLTHSSSTLPPGRALTSSMCNSSTVPPLHRSKTAVLASKGSRGSTLLNQGSGMSGHSAVGCSVMRKSEPCRQAPRSMSGLEAASAILRFVALSGTDSAGSSSSSSNFIRSSKTRRLQRLAAALSSHNLPVSGAATGGPASAHGPATKDQPARSQSSIACHAQPMHGPTVLSGHATMSATPLAGSSNALGSLMVAGSGGRTSSVPGGVLVSKDSYMQQLVQVSESRVHQEQQRHVVKAGSSPFLQDSRLARLMVSGNQRYSQGRRAVLQPKATMLSDC